MTITQIKYFITVAKCLSMTKASEQLFISQPALSRHIRNMEEELNIQLFVRTNSGIRLTPAGGVMLVGLEDIYHNYMSLMNRAEKTQRGLDGSLKIGVLDQTNIADFMPHMYHYFKDHLPNVALEFHRGSFSYLTTELYAGRLDLIFTLQFEICTKESIIYQYVSHSKDHIVMSAHHPLAQKENVTLDDVKNETFVLISQEDNPESAPLIFAICKEHGFVPQFHYAQSMSEQALWIECGLGVSILDSRCELKNNQNLRFYEFESNWDPSLVIAWHQNNYNPLISVFLKELNALTGMDDGELHGKDLEQ